MAARWMTFGAVDAPRTTDGSRSALPVAMAYRNTMPHVLRSRRAVAYRAARFDLAKRRKHFRRSDFGYGALADCRIGKVEQPALLARAAILKSVRPRDQYLTSARGDHLVGPVCVDKLPAAGEL